MATARSRRSEGRGARRNGGRRDLPDTIYAQASPRSIGGISLFDASATVDAGSVPAFFSDASVTQAAVARLRDAGFDVLQVSAATINIAGPPSAYERAFEPELVTRERTVIGPGQQERSVSFIDDATTEVPGLIETADTSFADVLEGIAIEEPVIYFADAFPPPVDYWHLDVPADVALGLNAEQAHRSGVTGRGVRVCMVDTGWYRHPFFVQRGYRVGPVVLAPGATAPQHDEMGHGTGESANVFAAAPDVDFTMVKQSPANATASFNAAVALRPHVISCSWGFDIANGPLGAAQQALAAAVATAVASGIVVVFSAGNGHFSFPGQHPDVISAGGVFMERNGALQASDYASGFRSTIYPGRNVPDVSGLVGMRPRAIYLMLPLEPGDEIDDGNAGGSHPNGDETADADGWAAFSGTSAAAPQLAGVCALVLQAAPHLRPAQVRDVLKRSARDVTTGHSNPRGGDPRMGNRATRGPDLATGAGLVDAHKATLLAKLRGIRLPTFPPVLRPPLPQVPLGPVVGPPGLLPPGPIPPGPPHEEAPAATLSQEDVAALEGLVLEGGGDGGI